MSFEIIEQAKLDLVKKSVRNVLKATEYASELQDRLQELFSQNYAKSTWGVEFLPNEKGLGATILTPYGSARAVAHPVITNGKVQIRYVFEKEICNEKGERLNVPVWAVCVDDNGEVTSDNGEHLYIGLNSFDDSRAGIGDIGLSVLYAVGAEMRNIQ